MTQTSAAHTIGGLSTCETTQAQEMSEYFNGIVTQSLVYSR
jgi:hypothetical protein